MTLCEMFLLFCISLLTSYLDATISKSHGTIKLWSEVQGRKRKNEGAIGDYKPQCSFTIGA